MVVASHRAAERHLHIHPVSVMQTNKVYEDGSE